MEPQVTTPDITEAQMNVGWFSVLTLLSPPVLVKNTWLH